jgi:DNA repair photolyase
LNGYELVYALLSNPYFIPGENGSLIAIGSVTEPFHGLTRHKTLDYIDKISRILGNPIQFSTKMYITRREAEALYKMQPGISPLVTIVSIKYARKLEPLAPPPEKRFEAIKNMREAGLKPFLFLRPMIPGIIEEEYANIIDLAREYGAVGVVAGSLRVTNTIIERFRKAGLPVDAILERLPRRPRGREQVPVDTRDIKREVERYVVRNGLLFFPEACMANMYTHGKACWKMIKLGLVKENKGLTPTEKFPSRAEIHELAGKVNVSLNDVRIRDYNITLYVHRSGGREVLLSEIIHSVYRVCVRIRYV